MDDFNKEVIKRVPLAEAVLGLWRWVTDEEVLRSIWNGSRGRCYDKVIEFSVMVHLISDALLSYAIGRESFQKNIENGVLTASIQAAYKKLSRIPLAVSQAFLQGLTRAMRQVFPQQIFCGIPLVIQQVRYQNHHFLPGSNQFIPTHTQSASIFLAPQPTPGLNKSIPLVVFPAVFSDTHVPVKLDLRVISHQEMIPLFGRKMPGLFQVTEATIADVQPRTDDFSIHLRNEVFHVFDIVGLPIRIATHGNRQPRFPFNGDQSATAEQATRNTSQRFQAFGDPLNRLAVVNDDTKLPQGRWGLPRSPVGTHKAARDILCRR